ncbi:RNA polymerase sigma factor [Glutamicibacter protophormiae]
MDTSKQATDRQLLAQAISGHGQSFGELFSRHRDRVFRHTYSVLGDVAGAEDATAMVFYEAWRKRDAIRLVDNSIIPWLLVTANYTLRNMVRQQRRYQRLLSMLPPPSDEPDFTDDLDARLATKGQEELVRQALHG